MSPLLYMFYNADLQDIAQQHRATGLGFIDDIVYGVQGNSDKENTRKLKHILNEAEEWRKKHGAQFEISKYILVHYTRNRNVATKASVIINGVRIEPSNEAKYLGVIFDQELRFKTHLQHVVKKAPTRQWHCRALQKLHGGFHIRSCDNYFKQLLHPAQIMPL